MYLPVCTPELPPLSDDLLAHSPDGVDRLLLGVFDEDYSRSLPTAPPPLSSPRAYLDALADDDVGTAITDHAASAHSSIDSFYDDAYAHKDPDLPLPLAPPPALAFSPRRAHAPHPLAPHVHAPHVLHAHPAAQYVAHYAPAKPARSTASTASSAVVPPAPAPAPAAAPAPAPAPAPASAPAPTTVPARRYKIKDPSKFCHVCVRSGEVVTLAPCANVLGGICRKAICQKCLDKHGYGDEWPRACANQALLRSEQAAAAASGGGSAAPDAAAGAWTCLHCRNVCPDSAQCKIYARTNRRRHEQLKKRKEEKARCDAERSAGVLAQRAALGCAPAIRKTHAPKPMLMPAVTMPAGALGMLPSQAPPHPPHHAVQPPPPPPHDLLAGLPGVPGVGVPHPPPQAHVPHHHVHPQVHVPPHHPQQLHQGMTPQMHHAHPQHVHRGMMMPRPPQGPGAMF